MTVVDWLVGIVVGGGLLLIPLAWLFPAQHYIDGEPTPRHRSTCRRCRRERRKS